MNKTFVRILSFIFLLLTAGILYAGPNQWTLTAGMNRPAFYISLSPVDNKVLFCTVGSGHVPLALYRSNDKGNTWSQVTQNDNAYWSYVFCSPASTSIVFMPDSKGLNRSINGGYTMSLVTSGLADGDRVTDMAYVNDQNKTIFVNSYSIYESTDGGNTWSPASTGMGYLSGIHLSASPVNSSLIYATGGNGLYKSIDKGENWSLLTTMTNSWRRICVNPSNPSNVYAIPLYQSYLYKSHDGGVTWGLITAGISSSLTVLDIDCDANDSTQIFLSTSNGYFKSSDSGDTWQPMNEGLSSTPPSAEDILVIPGKSPIILAATPFGVYSYTLTSTSVEKEKWEMFEEKKY